MQSLPHKQHLRHRIDQANCAECSADRERRFVGHTPFHYDHISAYLGWIRPRLAAIRAGLDTVEAHQWRKDFLKAMHHRISSHLPEAGRKHCYSYLERLKGTRFQGSRYTAADLRTFDASALYQ